MAWKEGMESMLKWVGVSVEGETRVDGINHFKCVKLQIRTRLSSVKSCVHLNTYAYTSSSVASSLAEIEQPLN